MKLVRLVRTVSYLKPVQIYYQCKYRLCGYRYPKPAGMTKAMSQDMDIALDELDADPEYVERMDPEGLAEGRISLLNETVKWHEGMWNAAECTHLWNFNLHYWEYGIALAVKYASTGDEKYYDTFKRMYLDWHKCACEGRDKDAWQPYTISLRIRNLMIAGHYLGDRAKKDGLDKQINDDIYKQYRFLETNQEKHLLGNHYMENTVTLFICSLAYEDNKASRRYARQLSEQMDEQILSDGMHYERSFMYHNLIMEDLLRCRLAMKSVGYEDEALLDKIDSNIGKMCDVVAGFETDHTGRIPAFNDAGNNVAKSAKSLMTATERLLDYRPTRLKRLEAAGYYRLDNGKLSLIFDVGELAPSYISGHGQCDALGVELYYENRPILVNGGTYNYQSDKRGYFRSTAAHNTLKAVGNEQSEVWGEHRTAGRISQVKCERADDNGYTGSVRDYRGHGLVRSISLTEKSVVIEDECDVKHESYWHLHPDCVIDKVEADRVEFSCAGGGRLRLVAGGGSIRSEAAYYSEEFGRIEDATVYITDAGQVRIEEV